LNRELVTAYLAAAGGYLNTEENGLEQRAAPDVMLYSRDASWAAQVLTESVNGINHANQYDGGLYRVTLEVTKFKIRLPLPNSDLNHCFEQAAKRDWSTALAAAQSIESKSLRSQAYIAACRNVL
jgi:hypothetical protein